MEKYKISKTEIIQLVTIFFGLLIAVLAECMMDFSFERFKHASFYFDIMINYIIMMLTYNSIRAFVAKSERRQENTAYKAETAKYADNLNFIRNNKLEEDIEVKVVEENLKRKKNAEEFLLQKYSYKLRLEHLDNITKDKLLEVCSLEQDKVRRKRNGTVALNRRGKRLVKVIRKIRNNKVKFAKFTLKDLLNDSEIEETKVVADQIDGKYYIFNLKQNVTKTTTFVITCTVTSSLAFNGFNSEFLIAIVQKLFLIGSASCSGIASANMYILYRKTIIANRNIFLNKCIDLSKPF